MKTLAFHRTDAKNVETILKDGILSMKSRGYTLPDFKEAGADVAADKLRMNGFKFGIPAPREVEAEVAQGIRFGFKKKQYRDAQWITEKTFVRVGGVEKHWSPEGVTIAVDMDALTETGLTIWEDSYGMDGDTEIHGDIPASCVVGVVSDEWMKENGYDVESGH